MLRFDPLFLAVALVTLGACDSTRQPAAPDLAASLSRSKAPLPPALTTTTPTYPPAVLYIVGREYVLKYRLRTLAPDDKQYHKYVERRLRELYPEKGYDGMIAASVAEVKQNRGKWERYERSMAAYQTASVEQPVDEIVCPPELSPCAGGGSSAPIDTLDSGFPPDPSWVGAEEHPAPVEGYVPTLEEEIDTLQAEPAEVSRIYYYESLAAGTYRIVPQDEIVMSATPRPKSVDDLIRLAGEGWTPLDGGAVRTEGLGTVLASSSVVAGLAYFYYWRIETAGDRAERLAVQYFPGLSEVNTRTDAFRHTFLSVQLRRYSTAWIAKLITDDHERRYSAKFAEERMDQHNNYLGREVKYEHFRGHWLWDRWDWKEWSTRVRSYVAGADRGEYIPEWTAVPSPTNDEIGARERAVPKWKYIFLSNK